MKSASITKKESRPLLMLTQKPSDLRAASKTESISTTTTHTKNNTIDHHTQNKLFWVRTRLIWTTRTKNKSLSIPTLKPGPIRSLPRKSR